MEFSLVMTWVSHLGKPWMEYHLSIYKFVAFISFYMLTFKFIFLWLKCQLKLVLKRIVKRENAISTFDCSKEWMIKSNVKNDHLIFGSIWIHNLYSVKIEWVGSTKKIAKPISVFHSIGSKFKKYWVLLNFMFCALPLVMFRQQTLFFIIFPSHKNWNPICRCGIWFLWLLDWYET